MSTSRPSTSIFVWPLAAMHEASMIDSVSSIMSW